MSLAAVGPLIDRVLVMVVFDFSVRFLVDRRLLDIRLFTDANLGTRLRGEYSKLATASSFCTL